MEYKYTGIVLGKYDVGETDRIYVIYTLEQGKIRTLAKGVRKMQARLAGQLENFNLVDVLIARNKGMGKIKSAIAEKNFSNIKNELKLLEKVFEVFRIAGRLIDDEQKDEDIFYLFLRYLNLLDKIQTEDDPLFFRVASQGFLYQFFSLTGYGIEVGRCALCQEKIAPGGNFFSARHGGIVCAECGQKVAEKIQVSDSAIKAMRIFSSSSLESLAKLKIEKEKIIELEKISSLFHQWISG
ncbi:MAG: DNA repair protein RecO (recombination protein O) [Parcubacteria group bacterium Athens0714_25]|nr:MAG: DNA repair protein RecO (recombination protein O) [Parcubacteria group bacterium Athens0714_25]